MKFAAVLVVNYLTPWYELSLEERIAIEHEHVFPSVGAFVKRGGKLTPVRAIKYGREAESFFILGFDEMEDYLDLVRELRSSHLLTAGLAVIDFETVGLEEAYFAERDKDRSPAVVA
ncbi:hypothetical protein ACFVFI_28370 [Streptomyces sp. NPDC057705]|uniref:hypothetical protein n=1 Tax=Streptomyces sp. NPDC057705 TaxID=3346222 RepID=UPI0036AA365C